MATTKSPPKKSRAKGAPKGARSSKGPTHEVIETSGEAIDEEPSEEEDADELEGPGVDEQFDADADEDEEGIDDRLSEGAAYESPDEDDTGGQSKALALSANKSKALATRDPPQHLHARSADASAAHA